MNSVIDDTRALLRLFQHSDYNDFHVRSGSYALFIARPTGGPNPMRSHDVRADEQRHISVTAPHIASLASILPVGSAVNADTVIARLALLDETIDVRAGTSGFVKEVLVGEGDLLEYGMPLARIGH